MKTLLFVFALAFVVGNAFAQEKKALPPATKQQAQVEQQGGSAQGVQLNDTAPAETKLSPAAAAVAAAAAAAAIAASRSGSTTTHQPVPK